MGASKSSSFSFSLSLFLFDVIVAAAAALLLFSLSLATPHCSRTTKSSSGSSSPSSGCVAAIWRKEAEKIGGVAEEEEYGGEDAKRAKAKDLFSFEEFSITS